MSEKRTSATAARQAARNARASSTLDLGKDVEDRIASYTPAVIEPDAWETVRPVVVAAVRAACPPSPGRAQHLMLPAAKLAVWALEHGVALDAQHVFTATLVDEWSNLAIAAGTPAKSVATDRSHLRALLPSTPASAATIGRGTGPVPYTSAEDLAVRRYVTGQRTPGYRSTGCLLYGLGRGAGLVSKELRPLQTPDVVDHGTGIEVVLADRTVWVLDGFCEVVRIGLKGRPDGYLLSGRNGQSRNIGEYVDRFTVPKDAPRLNLARCRATWIVDHLNRGTPLRVIRDAMGVTTLEQVAKLLDYVEAPGVEDVGRHLRGDP